MARQHTLPEVTTMEAALLPTGARGCHTLRPRRQPRAGPRALSFCPASQDRGQQDGVPTHRPPAGPVAAFSVCTRGLCTLLWGCVVFMHAGTCRCLWACVHMCVPMWEQSWRGRLCCRAQPCASLGLGLGMWLTSGSLCAGLPLDKVWGPIVWHPQSCWAHSVMVELTWEAGNMVLASGMPGI